MQKKNSIPSRKASSGDHAYLATASNSSSITNTNSLYSVGNEIGGSCDYYSDDIWSTNAAGELLCASRNTSKYVFFDVLLPSAFLIPIQCPTCRTLKQLKQDVFIQAKRFFLFYINFIYDFF